MELLDELPSVGEDERARGLNEAIAKEIGHQFGHDHGLAEARGEDDLSSTSIDQRIAESGLGLHLVVTKRPPRGRVLWGRFHQPEQVRRRRHFHLEPFPCVTKEFLMEPLPRHA